MCSIIGMLGAIPRWAWLGTWLAMIVLASFLPQGSIAARAFTLDGRSFLAHVVAYGVLSGMTFWSLEGHSLFVRAVAMTLLPVALGMGIEFLQPLVGRSSGWSDFWANSGGVAVSFVAAMSWGVVRS